MRVEASADDGAEVALLQMLKPIVRSKVPYRVLREAVREGGLTAQRVTALGRQYRNMERILALLTREGLIEPGVGGFTATGRGRRLVAQVRRAAEAGASGELVGRRLILVEDAPDVDLSTVERKLRRHSEVMRGEGSFERLAVVADDFRLASDLLAAVRRLGARAQMMRVVETVEHGRGR